MTSVSKAVSFTLTASDPDLPALPLTFAAGNPSHGILSGLNASTGAVTYTPTTGYTGLDSFTFTVGNGTNTSVTATVSITVNPLQIVTTTLPNGTIYADYDQTLAVSSAPGATITFSLFSGTLPTGLQLNTTTGQISGIATNANGGAPFNFTIQISDGVGGTATQAFAVAIAPPSITVTPTILTIGQVAVVYGPHQLTAAGGISGATYTYSVANGSALPPGLQLSSSGVVSGTPTGGGQFTLDVNATDSSPAGQWRTVHERHKYCDFHCAARDRGYAGFAAGRYCRRCVQHSVRGHCWKPGHTRLQRLPICCRPVWRSPRTARSPGPPTALGTYTFTVTATDSSTGTGPYSGTVDTTIIVYDLPLFISGPTANPNPAFVNFSVEFNVGVTPVRLRNHMGLRRRHSHADRHDDDARLLSGKRAGEVTR